MFKDTMEEIGQPVIPSKVVTTVEDALAFSEEIGFPLIIRPAFTLGGTGGGMAYNLDDLREIAGNGIRMSPIGQILVEQSVAGWKEIEFEVMRDSHSNVITICSMENIDPVGVHTGDSVVIAPAVTLSDKEYQMLRKASLAIVNALQVEGGCNCQFALNPDSFDIRSSRSTPAYPGPRPWPPRPPASPSPRSPQRSPSATPWARSKTPSPARPAPASSPPSTTWW
jgi:carbamoyl-phosphate synthase large subunit